MNERLPPHDLDAENAVLSAVMLEPDAYFRICDRVADRHFYSQANRRIWQACSALVEAGDPIDSVTVAGWLKSRERLADVGGIPYLARITDASPAVANLEAHADMVRDRARQREMIDAGRWIAANGYDPEPEFFVKAESKVFAICSDAVTKDTCSSIHEAIQTAFTKINEAAQRGSRFAGIPTGLRKLDEATSGMHAGDLIVVAARPGMGKTSLALGIAEHVASPSAMEDGTPLPGLGAMIFSLEMPRDQCAMRMTCSNGNVDVGKVRKGILSQDEWARLSESASFLAQCPVAIDDKGGASLLDIKARVRRQMTAWERVGVRLGVVVVDYIQLMSGIGDNREQIVSNSTRGLKQLAKDFDVPVVALSQLNRGVENRAGRRPQLSDLRESGAIEQDADTIIFIYRDDYYNQNSGARGIAELIISKQRNGPTGKVPVGWVSSSTTFRDLHPDELATWRDDE